MEAYGKAGVFGKLKLQIKYRFGMKKMPSYSKDTNIYLDE